MIELKNLHLRNFFSHSESQIDFEKLDGLILLEGKNELGGQYDSNGSGKSSVLEGIVYALTGNTLRNVGVNDMVNRNVGKNTMAEITLTNNSTPITISRYRKDEKFGDSIILVEDGKDISSRLNKSTQETINNKLGIPYNVLVNTILLGEGLSSRFTQLSDPDKKSLIESTLSLSYDVNALRDKVNSYLKDLKLDVSMLEGSITSMKSMINSFDPTDDVSGDVSKLQLLQSEVNNLQSEVSSLGSEIEVYTIKIRTLESSKISCERLYRDRDSVTSKINDLNSKIVYSNRNNLCHICGQILASEESKLTVKANHDREMSDLKTMLDNIEDSLRQMPEYSVITSKLQELTSMKHNVDERYRDLNNKLIKYTGEMASLKSSVDHRVKLMNDIEVYKTQVEADEKSYKSKKIDLSDYEYMYKLFSPTGLIVYILEDAVSYINDRLSIYTDILIDKSYKFELSKGKLGLVDESGASYQSLSNGEKRRLDIAIQFSLHDYVYSYCGLQLNYLFVDEVLDGLDQQGVDNIFEVLRLKMEYCKLKGIVCITHNSNLKDKFDKYITVVKKQDGMSYIK